MNPTSSEPSSPPNGALAKLGRFFAGPQLGTGLMVALIALLVAGFFAHLWLSGSSANLYPTVVYWLTMAGLADVPHSVLFASFAALWALVLAYGVLTRAPVLWREMRAKVPGKLPTDQGLLRMEFESQIGRERFRAVVGSWARRHLGPVSVACDDGRELQLVAERGRFGGLGDWIAHIGILIALGGVAASWQTVLEARLLVDEGSKVGYVELIQGKSPGWAPLKRAGREIPGFYELGFEIECSEFHPDKNQSFLRIYENGNLVSSLWITQGTPARYRDLSIYQVGFHQAATQDVNLAVTDRKLKVERRLPRLSIGSKLDMDAFRFEILEIQPETDLNGPAVQIEYQEDGKAAERFWVFQRHRDYDFAHRKESAWHFTLSSVQQRYGSELQLSRDAGAPWFWAGLWLIVAGLMFSLFSLPSRYWFQWQEGKITISGWSAKPQLFEPHFERKTRDLSNRLHRVEVGNGSV